MAQEILKKKWENYWYYYKWQTIAGLFILVVVLVTVRQCVSRPKYDTTVALVTTTAVSQEDQDALAQFLSSYIPDLNGDGKHEVGLDNIYIGSGQTQQTEMMALEAKLAAGDEMVFLCDDGGYARLKSLKLFMDAKKLAPGAPLDGSDRIPLKLLKAVKGQSFTDASDRLTIGMRITSGTTADRKDNRKNIDGCEQLVRNLVNNRKAG